LPAGEVEEGLLADVMLFFLKICGYYFVVLKGQCNLSPDYPQSYFRKDPAKTFEQDAYQNHSFSERLLGMR
jgi:hypothetical protein